MIRRALLAAIFTSTALIGLAYLLALIPGVGELWSAGAMIMGVSAIMVATMALGVIREGRVSPGLTAILSVVFFLLLAAFSAALLLPGETSTDHNLWLGLPRRAAIIIYGIGILPLFILPIAYALTFDLSAQDPPRRRDLEIAGVPPGDEQVGEPSHEVEEPSR